MAKWFTVIAVINGMFEEYWDGTGFTTIREDAIEYGTSACDDEEYAEAIVSARRIDLRGNPVDVSR